MTKSHSKWNRTRVYHEWVDASTFSKTIQCWKDPPHYMGYYIPPEKEVVEKAPFKGPEAALAGEIYRLKSEIYDLQKVVKALKKAVPKRKMKMYFTPPRWLE